MEKQLEFVSLRSDTTFKYLFKTEKGRLWFEDLILHTTGLDITEYELYDNELNSGNNKKDYRLDILLKNKDADYIVIEMNNTSKNQSIKARYYLYRVAGKKFNEGKNYKETKNILIMFNNYRNELIKDLKIANYTLNDKINNIEVNDIDIHEIYLPNYKKLCYDKLNEAEKKLYLFNCESFKEMKSLNLSNEDRYIVEELWRLSMDDKFYDDYDAEHVNKMLINTEHMTGYEEGLEKGIEQGSKDTSIEIAKKMLMNNEPVEKISNFTNLSINEIEKLVL